MSDGVSGIGKMPFNVQSDIHQLDPRTTAHRKAISKNKQ
jgi:hypothetical protein